MKEFEREQEISRLNTRYKKVMNLASDKSTTFGERDNAFEKAKEIRDQISKLRSDGLYERRVADLLQQIKDTGYWWSISTKELNDRDRKRVGRALSRLVKRLQNLAKEI